MIFLNLFHDLLLYLVRDSFFIVFVLVLLLSTGLNTLIKQKKVVASGKAFTYIVLVILLSFTFLATAFQIDCLHAYLTGNGFLCSIARQ